MKPVNSLLARFCLIPCLAATMSAQTVEKEKAPVVVDPAPVGRQAGVITSFAPVVEKVTQSVVQISTSKNVRIGARDPRRMPGFDDPLFRRFFGLPEQDEEQGPDRRETPAQPQPRRGGKDNLRKEAYGLGSGVVVSSEGHILTNNHVIEGADDILVTLSGDKKEYKAKKVGTDPDTDLAVLKLEGKEGAIPAITFADSGKLRVGDFAIAVGNPFGLTQSVTMGIISATGRHVGILGTGMRAGYEDFIQTDASINPGNSGGALVDIEGRLIGINTAIFSRTGTNAGIGFAVPANLARWIMDNIIKNGRVVRGYLGVGIQPLDDALASRFKLKSTDGALVNLVTPDSPAEKAGIKEGDVITAVEGKKVEGTDDLRMTVSGLMPGRKVEVKYLRGGQEKTAQIELAEMPGRDTASLQPPKPEAADPDVLDGVTVGDIDAEARKKFNIPESTRGVIVKEIDENSACFEAGIRVGDVIQEIEQTPLKNADDAVALSEKLKKEKQVLLRVSTRGASRYVVVKED
jgi:serine protease Do